MYLFAPGVRLRQRRDVGSRPAPLRVTSVGATQGIELSRSNTAKLISDQMALDCVVMGEIRPVTEKPGRIPGHCGLGIRWNVPLAGASGERHSRVGRISPILGNQVIRRNYRPIRFVSRLKRGERTRCLCKR